MNIELRHLRYFIAVAEELHFGRAAERLRISQPPLSQQIQALEEMVGARLLARNNRNVSLTQAGEMFLKEAYQVLDQVGRAAEKAGLPPPRPLSAWWRAACAPFASSPRRCTSRCAKSTPNSRSNRC
jgi:DNA-binding transcriptional LysR family regulator